MRRHRSGRLRVDQREEYDFLGLRHNNCVRRLLEADGIVVAGMDTFFSDHIVRINSHEERKVRILLVTNQKLYILIQKENPRTEYSIKANFHLSHIRVIEIATNNALLLNLQLDNK